MLRIAVIALALALGACAKREPAQHVDLDRIEITGEARMRTDTVGEGKHAEISSFVLVDAKNASGTGAYVTLGGSFTDASGAAIGALKPQSLWIPAGESRTFALVDAAREPRPTSTAAKIEVRGALIATPPRAKIADLTTTIDDGLVVARARLVNDADRVGRILVLASFHDKDGSPMTRPFSLVEVPAGGTQPLQFVGPPGSVHGTIYIGDETY